MTLKMAMTKGMAEAVTKMVMVASPSRTSPGLILTHLRAGGQVEDYDGDDPEEEEAVARKVLSRIINASSFFDYMILHYQFFPV